jgi:acyl-CoA synthetase (AMP-forming)/AMP-acid ligase II
MADVLRREASFLDLVVWALDRFPDRVAIVEDERELTYRQVRDRISQLAAALGRLGFGRGTGLMTLAGNQAEALFAGLAVRTLGCWAGALHPLGSVDDQAFILEDSEALGLVFEPSLYDGAVSEIAERVPSLKHALSLGPSAVGQDLAALADAEVPGPLVSVAEADDLCSLGYSGGTTGRPKGVMQRHRTVVEMTNLINAGWQLPEEIRFLAVTPISHAAVCFVLPTWMNGGTVVLQKGFDPEGFYRAVEQHRITLTFAVPTMLYGLLDHPATKSADVASIETVVYGAAPMSPTRLQEALDVFGPVFVQLYGQAEAPATVTALRKEEHDLSRPHLFGSCGRPLPGVTVALLNEEDKEVALGEVGEICVRGAIVADGYWKRPELTAETLRSDWLHTGDMATADEDGYLYIVDRKKDMIISGGFNVYPREIEDVLTSHPEVAMAVVVGVPDDKWGEAVKALVVLRPDAGVSAADLIALVKERKGAVYAPKSVDVVDELPVTGIGKADRKAVRARFWPSDGRQVH